MKQFYNPVQIQMGQGALAGLPKAVGTRSCVLITSPGMKKRGVVSRIQEMLGDRLLAVYAEVDPNPTIASCMKSADALGQWLGDDRGGTKELVVIGLGGGSALDTAKTIATLGNQTFRHLPTGGPGAVATRPGTEAETGRIADWLDQHFRGGVPFPKEFKPLPIIAIPTTAGTGSEITMWGTVWDEKILGKKHSISHPTLYPEVAIVDPELTLTVPLETTVFTALDTLSHSMEAIWNHHWNPVSDSLASRAIPMIVESLPELVKALEAKVESTELLPLREKIQQASVLAGLAFSNTRTALAHSISYPLTSKLGIPHGLACSLTLPEVLRLNHQADPERCSWIVRALGVRTLDEAVRRLYRFFEEIGLKSKLLHYAPSFDGIASIQQGFITPGRADNNVAVADDPLACRILKQAYDAIQA